MSFLLGSLVNLGELKVTVAGDDLSAELGFGGASGASSSAVSAHIARTAARLFAERGYEATSVREIVEAAGVTKPTLYYHFGSKEGVAQALLVKPQAGLVARMKGVLESGTDSRRTLGELLECLFAFCREDPDRARLMFAVFFGPKEAGLSGTVRNWGCELDGVWQAAVGGLVDEGWVSAARAVDFEVAMRGLHVIYILGFLYKGGELPGDLGARIVHDLLVGFGRAGGPSGD